MSYFFTEKLNYYLKKTPLLFLFQAFRNPIQTIYKSLNKEPEDHIFDKMNILRKCYKIKINIREGIQLNFLEVMIFHNQETIKIIDINIIKMRQT